MGKINSDPTTNQNARGVISDVIVFDLFRANDRDDVDGHHRDDDDDAPCDEVIST